MSVEINPPFRVFTDVDGEPLEDGYIRIGAANQNPEVVPISVYWDIELTIPAAQPIRTLGGYPSRSGTPSRMYIDALAYSISVSNKNLTLIYSDLDNHAGAQPLQEDLANITDPTKGAAGVGRAIRHINSFTELRALIGQYDGEVVYLRGRTTAIPGLGEGEFIWRLGSSTTDDDGYWIGSDAAGRWERAVSFGSDVDASWYNVATANSATTNTTGLNSAISRAIAVGIKSVRLPGKGYFSSNALTSVDQVIFRGDGAFFEAFLYEVIQDNPYKLITLPAAYSYYPGKVYANGAPGQAVQTADVEDMWLDNEVQGIVVYFVSPTGSDANSGTVINSPLKNLTTAIAKADVGVIKMFPGTYYANTSIGTAIGVTVNRDIQIESLSGAKDAIVHTGVDSAAITWTLNTGSTYEAVPGLVVNQVFDNSYIDENGDPFRLTLRTSIATVNSNPGSWWYDSAVSKVYVRLPTGVSPSGIAVLFGSAEGTITGNRALFCKNIKFHGGGLGAFDNGTNKPRFYAKNCDFKYGANNGVRTLAGDFYSQKCTFALAGLDNINYHDNGSLISRGIEIDCTSYGAGYLLSGGADSNNASSMHDTGVILRVNGVYSRSHGPNIPDTGTSTSWNIGVTVKDSLPVTASQNVGFYTETAMTLIDCAASGNANDLRVATGGVMSVRNIQTGGTKLLEGAGKLQQF